jgi:hypothetical protein
MMGLRRSPVVSKLRLARKRPFPEKDDGPRYKFAGELASPILKLAFHFQAVKELRSENSDLSYLRLNADLTHILKSSLRSKTTLPLTAPPPGETMIQGILHATCPRI